MKRYIAIICFAMLTMNAGAQQKQNQNYDSTLARSLKGNENGMKKYVLAILKTGSNTNANQATTDSLFAGHMSNIKRLADLGSLSVAGPLGKNDKTYRGIFIFNVETIEEAQKLLVTDPAVKGGLLEAEMYTLWCTAALQEVPKIHSKIQKNIN